MDGSCLMKYLPLILLMTCGCGVQQQDSKPVTVQQDLAPYVQSFEQYYNVDASYVSVGFADLGSPTLGVCYSWTDGTREIQIDRSSWSSIDEIGREQLMYHELGHCVFNLQHDNRLVIAPDGTIYGSIMNQYWFGDSWFYSEYRNQYKAALGYSNQLVIP